MKSLLWYENCGQRQVIVQNKISNHCCENDVDSTRNCQSNFSPLPKGIDNDRRQNVQLHVNCQVPRLSQTLIGQVRLVKVLNVQKVSPPIILASCGPSWYGLVNWSIGHELRECTDECNHKSHWNGQSKIETLQRDSIEWLDCTSNICVSKRVQGGIVSYLVGWMICRPIAIHSWRRMCLLLGMHSAQAGRSRILAQR